MTNTPHLPFVLKEEDIKRLNSNQGFQIVRQFLASQNGCNSFCSDHQTLPPDVKETFFLHRDIHHALILPLVQIHTQASNVASSLLQTLNPDHLELAFRGNARGAFSWLQCFVAEEGSWCTTRGCPACIVFYTLSMEPTIRLSVVASRLSETLQQLFDEVFLQGKGDGEESSPTLPGFGFWEECLKDAVDKDEFWGEGYWDEIEARATDLEQGIRDLLDECLHPRSSPGQKGDYAKRSQSAVSGFAKRQAKLAIEEQEWMQRAIVACWSTLLTEAVREVALELRSSERAEPSPRTRSLTT